MHEFMKGRPVTAAILSSVVRETAQEFEVEVFFDADCPLCRKEIGFLRRWDRHRRIRFTDIAAVDFDAAAVGIPYDRLMAEIHARLPDARWIRGVEVFRRLYSAIGLRWIVAATRWPGLSQIVDVGYRVFARNRLKWTGRCTAACGVG